MKYDKMVECSLERSKQKVETAKREIQEMLESKEKIKVVYVGCLKKDVNLCVMD